MKLKSLLGTLAVVGALASAGNAATVTEGTNRAQVIGTTVVADPGPVGVDLGIVTATDVAEVYGGIFGGQDGYRFTTTADITSIDLIFGPIETLAGFITGGLTTVGNTTKTLSFALFAGSNRTSSPALLTTSRSANLTSGPTEIFGGIAAGTYYFDILGGGDSTATTYDIRFSGTDVAAPIPLPATALLLLAGLGGLGVAARRKKA